MGINLKSLLERADEGWPGESKNRIWPASSERNKVKHRNAFPSPLRSTDRHWDKPLLLEQCAELWLLPALFVSCVCPSHANGTYYTLKQNYDRLPWIYIYCFSMWDYCANKQMNKKPGMNSFQNHLLNEFILTELLYRVIKENAKENTW